MAKRSKGPQIESVTDPKSGHTATVHYDRETGDFWALIPPLGDRVADRDGKVCVRKVREALARSRSGFEWSGAIVVDHGGGPKALDHRFGGFGGGDRWNARGASLSFEFWRLEVSPKPGAPGAVVARPHPEDVADHDRECRSQGADVRDYHPHEEHVQIPYTVETWDALQRLKLATERTYANLVALFADPELLLTTQSAPLLTAGAEAPVEGSRKPRARPRGR